MATLADLHASRAAAEATRPLTPAEEIEHAENLALVAQRENAVDAEAKTGDVTAKRRAFYEAESLAAIAPAKEL